MLAHAGRYDEAVSVAREAVQLAERTDALNMQADILVDLAEVLRTAGHRHEADETMRKALALYERKGNLASAETCRAALGRSDARLASGGV